MRRFGEAFQRHDVDAVMAAMSEDCVFENTWPPPDGERHVGPAAARRFWERFVRETPSAAFETEELFAAGGQCVVRWVYRWRNADGSPGHVRGVDVIRVHDGKVAEKLGYANALRVQGWIGNLALHIEHELFGQSAPSVKLRAQYGPVEGLAVEDRLKRLGEQLLPLLDRANRQGPTPAVAIGRAEQVNVAERQANAVVRD